MTVTPEDPMCQALADILMSDNGVDKLMDQVRSSQIWLAEMADQMQRLQDTLSGVEMMLSDMVAQGFLLPDERDHIAQLLDSAGSVAAAAKARREIGE